MPGLRASPCQNPHLPVCSLTPQSGVAAQPAKNSPMVSVTTDFPTADFRILPLKGNCATELPGLAVILGDTPFGTTVLTLMCATAPSNLASDRVAARPAGRLGRSGFHARRFVGSRPHPL